MNLINKHKYAIPSFERCLKHADLVMKLRGLSDAAFNSIPDDILMNIAREHRLVNVALGYFHTQDKETQDYNWKMLDGPLLDTSPKPCINPNF